MRRCNRLARRGSSVLSQGNPHTLQPRRFFSCDSGGWDGVGTQSTTTGACVPLAYRTRLIDAFGVQGRQWRPRRPRWPRNMQLSRLYSRVIARAWSYPCDARYFSGRTVWNWHEIVCQLLRDLGPSSAPFVARHCNYHVAILFGLNCCCSCLV
jgi:hypothetical protein